MSKQLINIGTSPNSGNGEGLRAGGSKINSNFNEVYAHLEDTNNPHNVTKSDVGLPLVDNTRDVDKPISSATQEALSTEAQSRAFADSVNASAISVESTARQSADATLQSNINGKQTSLAPASQSEMEAGTETGARNMSPLRVAQAISALAVGGSGVDGRDGWSSQLAIFSDGERRVLQLTDWIGGSGTKPDGVGYFLGSNGLDILISNGIDIRGGIGGQGPQGQIGNNGEVSVAQLNDVIADLSSAIAGKAEIAHTHPLSDLVESGATSGQVPTWNGSEWIPATPTGGGASAFNLRGDWLANNSYEQNDVVAYQGSSWAASDAIPADAIQPVTPGQSSVWQILSERGQPGEPGITGGAGEPGQTGGNGPSAYAIAVAAGYVGTESQWIASLSVGINWRGAWSSIPNYSGDNIIRDGVSHQGSSYVALHDNYFTEPSGSPTYWQIIAERGSVGGTGPSAYESALANGYVGSEASWVASLVGPVGEISSSALITAISGTSSNSNAIDLLELTVSLAPTQAQVQAITDKLDELITALRRP